MQILRRARLWQQPARRSQCSPHLVSAAFAQCSSVLPNSARRFVRAQSLNNRCCVRLYSSSSPSPSDTIILPASPSRLLLAPHASPAGIGGSDSNKGESGGGGGDGGQSSRRAIFSYDDLMDTLRMLVPTVAAIIFFRMYVVDVMKCAGPSMMPTMNAKGDLVVVSQLPFSPRRGDIVVAETVKGHRVCKRVVALGGDVVIIPPPPIIAGTMSFELFEPPLPRYEVIPDGSYWLQGDNVRNSTDSRHYGAVPKEKLRGKVVARLFPLVQPHTFESTMKFVDKSNIIVIPYGARTMQKMFAETIDKPTTTSTSDAHSIDETVYITEVDGDDVSRVIDSLHAAEWNQLNRRIQYALRDAQTTPEQTALITQSSCQSYRSSSCPSSSPLTSVMQCQ